MIIIKSNSNFKPLLCLLGRSLVIVPEDIQKGDYIDYNSLIDNLESTGFNTIKTKVGKLF